MTGAAKMNSKETTQKKESSTVEGMNTPDTRFIRLIISGQQLRSHDNKADGVCGTTPNVSCCTVTVIEEKKGKCEVQKKT